MNDVILKRELEFHNARFTEEVRVAQDKYYFAIKDCDAKYERLLMENAQARAVLDYGCAKGEWALQVASVAEKVYGIDISDVAIATASAAAAERGINHVHFEAMDAQKTTFADNTFDLVFGIGIIHHLDTRRAFEEVARILKPGGVAIFREPLGSNLLINLYRAATPKARTVDEHPLTPADLAIARDIFRVVDWEFFGLSTLASVPFQRTPFAAPIYRATAALDRALFHIPSLRWQAWNALMTLTK